MSIRPRPNGTAKFCGLAALLLPLCAVAFAATPLYAQDILVSKKVKGTNIAPQPTVHPGTGDVLVVWSNLSEDGTTSLVYAGFLKRNPDGTFKKAKKGRLVSDGTGFHSNPRAAWIPAAKRYLVVWDTRRDPTEPSTILGRALNKRGKPKGPIQTIVDDGRSNFVAHPAPTETGASVIYSAKDATARVNATTGEIIRVDMGPDFKADATIVLDAYDASSLLRLPEGIVHLFDCQVVVLQEAFNTDEATIHILLLKNGELEDRLEFPGTSLGATRVLEVVPGVGVFHLLVTDKIEDGGIVQDSTVAEFAIRELCTVLRTERWVIDPRRMTLYQVDLAERGADVSGFRREAAALDAILVEGGDVRARAMSDTMEEGPTQTLAEDVGDALFIRAEALPAAAGDKGQAADLIVTWLVGTKGSNTEIRALAARRED